MRFRIHQLFCTLLCLGLALSSCNLVDNGARQGQVAQVTLQLVGDQGPRANQAGDTRASGAITTVIYAVPDQEAGQSLSDYYNQVVHYGGLSTVYAKGIMDQSNNQVTMELPLGSPLRLLKLVFNGSYSLDQVQSTKPYPFDFGLSDVFTPTQDSTDFTLYVGQGAKYTPNRTSSGQLGAFVLSLQAEKAYDSDLALYNGNSTTTGTDIYHLLAGNLYNQISYAQDSNKTLSLYRYFSNPFPDNYYQASLYRADAQGDLPFGIAKSGKIRPKKITKVEYKFYDTSGNLLTTPAYEVSSSCSSSSYCPSSAFSILIYPEISIEWDDSTGYPTSQTILTRDATGDYFTKRVISFSPDPDQVWGDYYVSKLEVYKASTPSTSPTWTKLGSLVISKTHSSDQDQTLVETNSYECYDATGALATWAVSDTNNWSSSLGSVSLSKPESVSWANESGDVNEWGTICSKGDNPKLLTVTTTDQSTDSFSEVSQYISDSAGSVQSSSTLSGTYQSLRNQVASAWTLSGYNSTSTLTSYSAFSRSDDHNYTTKTYNVSSGTANFAESTETSFDTQGRYLESVGKNKFGSPFQKTVFSHQSNGAYSSLALYSYNNGTYDSTPSCSSSTSYYGFSYSTDSSGNLTVTTSLNCTSSTGKLASLSPKLLGGLPQPALNHLPMSLAQEAEGLPTGPLGNLLSGQPLLAYTFSSTAYSTLEMTYNTKGLLTQYKATTKSSSTGLTTLVYTYDYSWNSDATLASQKQSYSYYSSGVLSSTTSTTTSFGYDENLFLTHRYTSAESESSIYTNRIGATAKDYNSILKGYIKAIYTYK